MTGGWFARSRTSVARSSRRRVGARELDRALGARGQTLDEALELFARNGLES